jgi:transposase
MAQNTGTMTVGAIGIDVGDDYSHVCVLDDTGAIIEESRIPTKPEAIERRFRGAEPARIALEVGSHSAWMSRVLEGCGHEVIVANARKLRLVYQNDSKSDKVDAEYLARLARVDPKLLSPIKHRGVQAQVDRALLNARDSLVRNRTMLVNTARGMVKSIGGKLPRCSVEAFPKSAAPHVPRELRVAVPPLLEMIATLTKQIRVFDDQVEQAAEHRYPQTRLLRQIKGVGAITAVAFVTAIEDPSRFRSSRAVASYFGLRPRKQESSKSDPQLRITKAGDQNVRRLLVQAAHYLLGPFGADCDLRRWGMKLCERGGKNGKKRAVIAVARKLTVLLHRLWITGEVYEPLREAQRTLTKD